MPIRTGAVIREFLADRGPDITQQETLRALFELYCGNPDQLAEEVAFSTYWKEVAATRIFHIFKTGAYTVADPSGRWVSYYPGLVQDTAYILSPIINEYAARAAAQPDGEEVANPQDAMILRRARRLSKYLRLEFERALKETAPDGEPEFEPAHPYLIPYTDENGDLQVIQFGHPAGAAQQPKPLRPADRLSFSYRFTHIPRPADSPRVTLDTLRETAPAWMQLFHDDDHTLCFLQHVMAAMCQGVHRGRISKPPRIFILTGPSGSGKTTILRALNLILSGSSSTFKKSLLFGKDDIQFYSSYEDSIARFRIMEGETKEREQWNTDRAKSLATFDRASTRQIFQAPFEYNPQATYAFSTNYGFPFAPSDAQGIERRVCMLTVTRKDIGSNDDVAYAQKLMAEFPYVLQFLLDMTADPGFDIANFPLSPAVYAETLEALYSANPATQFAMTCVRKSSDPDHVVHTFQLKRCWEQFMVNRGHAESTKDRISANAMYAAINKIYNTRTPRPRRILGNSNNTETVYTHLQFTQEGQDLLDVHPVYSQSV